MLYYYKENTIFKKVFYDEPTSIIFIYYMSRGCIEYFKVDRVFFYRHLLPLISNDKDFRTVLYAGSREGLAFKLSPQHPDVEMVQLRHLDIYDK